MYQQFRVENVDVKIVTAKGDHWLNIFYEGEDNGYMSFFLTGNRVEIAKKLADLLDLLTDQLAVFEKGGE